MPSSISSSDAAAGGIAGCAPRWRWPRVLVLAVAVAALIVGAVETHWRAQDYRQNILDSAELWSIQRDRVYAKSRMIPLAILGASHIEYSLDTKLLKELLPRYQPVMLARNGHYPLATLADLARDERFHGLVLCDIDSRGLTGYYRDAQQDYVDYFHRQWSPSWHLHRVLLTHWQRAMLVAEPDYGATSELKRLFASAEPPWRSPTAFHADRSGDIDFIRADQPALTRGFVEGYEYNQRLHPVEDAGQWLTGLQSVAAWVAAVRAHGGDVVFVRTPTSGKLRELEDAAYPRAIYWDRLSAATGAATIHSDDVSGLKSINLPDGSHVDMHDKPAYTRALVDALAARGLVQR